MTVTHLDADYGVTAKRVALVAERLDDVVPGWAEAVDSSLFPCGEIETGPLAQVRASLATEDPRWHVLAQMCWNEHPMCEEWRGLWNAAWQTEALRLRGVRARV